MQRHFAWVVNPSDRNATKNGLQGRVQRLVINSKYSEWSGVVGGVPQGSVLGPILFNSFINDIEDGMKSSISVFADDTKLSRAIT